jgi:hypothetical protein
MREYEEVIIFSFKKELKKFGSSVCVMQWTGVIRDGSLI